MLLALETLLAAGNVASGQRAGSPLWFHACRHVGCLYASHDDSWDVGDDQRPTRVRIRNVAHRTRRLCSLKRKYLGVGTMRDLELRKLLRFPQAKNPTSEVTSF